VSRLPFDDDGAARRESSSTSPRASNPASSPGRPDRVPPGSARVSVTVPGSAAAPPQGEAPPIARRRRVLSVSELSARLRGVIESEFADVWVEGEISNGRSWNSGHFYFTLKDAGAQVKGVVFRSSLRQLRFRPEDGLHVVARGRISVYEPKGEYQLVCDHLEPQGYGPLQLAFEQLKRKLAAEGLFDTARKRPLPALPRQIGIVTSIDGAALRDIVRVLRRRYPNAHLVIAPTRVQGDGAAADIARALRLVSRLDAVDVIIVGRGGGSLEDLWAFNEEAVARAIATCPVPVISAVGHETDVTIADFVADLRAPTPSAAAELVVRRKDEFAAHIDRLAQRLGAAARSAVRRLESRLLVALARPGMSGLRARLAWRTRHVAELTTALVATARQGLRRRGRRVELARRALDQFDPRHRLGRVRAALVADEARLRQAMAGRRHAALTRAQGLAARLHGLSPLAVLGRGYAVCWTADRTRILRDAATVAPGETIRVTLERGELTARVGDDTPR
jgi:exodeoxyribonuclease VII large subunit